MTIYNKSLEILNSMFAKDCQFALATTSKNVPSVRVIDTFYDDGYFYIVTYAKTQKVLELEANPSVALCKDAIRFTGQAINIGHPLKPENAAIREKLVEVFAPWYFAHNNEDHEDMCYVRVSLDTGFFYQDGTGYNINFKEKTAKSFPFDFDVL